jgi:glycosyltransferase involved in cell wall biosynthesis
MSIAKDSSQSLSIIIPAYQEENGIGPVLESLKAQMDETGIQYEIVVIDDGSDDGTYDAASAHAGENVRILQHKVNRGYGAALKTGIRHAHHNLICITDADGTYPNERIPDLLAHMIENELDMVVGARTGQNVAIPLIRRPAKWAIRTLASIVASESIPDINSGMRIFKRRAALQFFSLLPDGFSFTTTITLGMLTNNYLVGYVPIDYFQRVGQSKIKPIRDTMNFVQLILRIALYFAPLKIFVPLSALLFVLAILWGIVSTVVFGRFADASTLVIMMAALQTFVVGLLAELVNKRAPNVYQQDSAEGDLD